MIMSQDTENFDSLRKLLSVKRHEQPPPGYFDQFSSEVMARLRAGEHEQKDLWRELGEEASWLQRLWASLDARPALAGAFGVLVCGVVLTGIYFSQQGEPQYSVVNQMDSWSVPGAANGLALGLPGAQQATTDSTNSAASPSTGGLPTGSLFDQIGGPGKTAPVNFSPGGN